MHEQHVVAALIERIVAEAQIPSTAERDDGLTAQRDGFL